MDRIHYLHFGILLFGIAGSVSIIVSLLTPPIPEESLYRLTFWSRHSTKVRVDLEQDTQYNEGGEAGNSTKYLLILNDQVIIFVSEIKTEDDKARDAAEFLYEPSDQKK